MKVLKNKRGMTIVEVLIAFLLMSILTSAFLLVFSSGVVNILDFGSRSRALASANEAMEKVYSIQEPSQTLIEAELNAQNGMKIESSPDLYIYNTGKDFNYFIQYIDTTVSTGFRVTIVYFYRNGEKFIDLEAFVREGD